MSVFGDIGSFEIFNLKDMLGKIKKDPERLFVGAADPFGSRLWGGVLGKKYEPIVDQMGGAYGGSPISAFGNKDGGVYARAKDAGINTKSGGAMHDAAHVLAAFFAGGYGADKLGGLMPSGGNFGGVGGGSNGSGWQQYMAMLPQQSAQRQQPQQQDAYIQPSPYMMGGGYSPDLGFYLPTNLPTNRIPGGLI